MPAGTFRARVYPSILTPFGTYSMPVDFAQTVDEVFGPHTYEVPNGTTDQSIPGIATAGLTTVQALVIVADQTIAVKLGAAGSNVAVSMSAQAPLCLLGTSLTAVSLSNSSGNTANVTLMVGGT